MTASKAVAVIGGGISGATAARALSRYDGLVIHMFDQGRRGAGGRASSRDADSGTVDGALKRWDHGCQFFRADTDRFREVVADWISKGYAKEWRARFDSSDTLGPDGEFFGLPSRPPFYVGADGMQGLVRSIIDSIDGKLTGSSSSSAAFEFFPGTRVARLECGPGRRWTLHGTSGAAAFHDTSEKIVRDSLQSDGHQILGKESGYDAVLLTDVSSSFGGWHRASAGVPERFAKRVRDRSGSRAPLFAAMITFDGASGIPFDAASFDDPVVWFAAKSSSKPGMEGLQKECWTVVSTPEYAMEKIEETPMQDPKTGEFIPQSREYLTSVPGPDLCNSFKSLIGRMGQARGGSSWPDVLPEIVHLGAQRWGSAMPCRRRRSERDDSSTERVISGVTYDSVKFPLAPTREELEGSGSFLADEDLMLFQAGDMVSSYTPGLEGAALSALDAAECIYETLQTRCR